MQTFQSKFFIPGLGKGVVGLYRFTPFSMAFTLAEDQKVSIERNRLASFVAHFLTDQNVCYGVESIQVEHPQTTEFCNQGK